MKLFVWNNPYSVSYGGSLLIVVAETEEEARKQVVGAPSYDFGTCDAGTRSPTKQEPIGAPDRVVDVPCAEWHAWYE